MTHERHYVVCMDSYRVRDAQTFDTTGFTDEQLDAVDPHSEAHEDRWHDMEPSPLIAIVEASSEKEACEMAGKENRYDPRCLYAIEIATGT